MQEVARQLVDALNSARPIAYCRLVETRGSTPQKAGAMMLVYADGSQAGTLGGGCVEAEVKRRAAVLHEGKAEIATFQLDSDYGWDDGLICGGRMQILIDPIRDEAAKGYYQRLAEAIAQGQGVTEAIVFDSAASNLSSPVSYLFNEEDELFATLYSGESIDAPSLVSENLKSLASRPRPYAAHGIAFLPSDHRCRLLIVGGGHVGQAVAALAAGLQFDVWVVDDRADIVSPERFPQAQRRISGSIEEVLANIEITPDTYCMIVTRGHNHDEQALYHLADRGARYVGMIGSRRKIRMIFDDLLEKGISAEALERVYAPLGIDIGSQTVPEIAVSICAELVSHRNRSGIVPGRPEPIRLTN